MSRHFLELGLRAHAGFENGFGPEAATERRVRVYWHTVPANAVPRDIHSRLPAVRVAILVRGERRYAGGRRAWQRSSPRATRASWRTVRWLPWELFPTEETSMRLGTHPDVVLLQPNDVAAIRVGLDNWFERGEALSLSGAPK